MEYTIFRAVTPPRLTGGWDDSIWATVPALHVDRFHPRGSDHRPMVRAKLLYDAGRGKRRLDKAGPPAGGASGLYIIFDVRDRYVQCLQTQPQSMVCRDSCVEFFVEPRPGAGYFNFEINCGGTPLVHYNTPGGAGAARGRADAPVGCPQDLGSEGGKRITPVSADLLGQLRIYHSLPQLVQPERPEAVNWRIEYFIPLALFERYLGPFGDLAGQTWRGNFCKCADRTSHPHWATWAPIGTELDFHQPRYFGTLRFAG